MNRDEAKQLLPILESTCAAMKAFASGSAVQYGSPEHGWTDIDNPGFNVDFRDGAVFHYRIKPEPKLRPWKCDEGPSYLIAKSKLDANRYWPFRLCRKVANGKYRTGPKPETDFISNEELADLFVWVHEDGTEHPCGVLEAQP